MGWAILVVVMEWDWPLLNMLHDPGHNCGFAYLMGQLLLCG